MQQGGAYRKDTDSGFARRRLAAAVIAAAFILQFAAPARPDDRWQEAAGGAVAILPAPIQATAIVGGSLSCAEQRWRFLLRAEPGTVPAGARATARLVIGEEMFETEASETAGALDLVVPRDMLEPLKNGSRLGFSIGEKGSIAKAVFGLGGSRAVIEAIAPRCSPVDMSAYEPITLSPTAPSVGTAAGLMKAEAKLFRAATGKQPVFASAMLLFNGGRRLLLASLCGSTAYYGPSGCTLSGFAAEGDGAWREVYNTEGLALYRDPKSPKDGWPDLVTLPAGGAEANHWTWNGTAYELRAEAVAEETVAEQGDISE